MRVIKPVVVDKKSQFLNIFGIYDRFRYLAVFHTTEQPRVENMVCNDNFDNYVMEGPDHGIH